MSVIRPCEQVAVKGFFLNGSRALDMVLLVEEEEAHHKEHCHAPPDVRERRSGDIVL